MKKLFLINLLFFFSPILFYEKTLALSNHRIKEICKNSRVPSNCKKELRNKIYNLRKGKSIEIPVIPFKG